MSFCQRIDSVVAAAKAVATAFAIALVVAFHGAVDVQPSRTLVSGKGLARVMPVEPGSKYEDPLDEALKHAGLGEVTGGGTSLTKEKTIDWVGLRDSNIASFWSDDRPELRGSKQPHGRSVAA